MPGSAILTSASFRHECLLQEWITKENRANENRQLLAKTGVIEARSHSKWPPKGLSSGTPDPTRLACSGMYGWQDWNGMLAECQSHQVLSCHTIAAMPKASGAAVHCEDEKQSVLRTLPGTWNTVLEFGQPM